MKLRLKILVIESSRKISRFWILLTAILSFSIFAARAQNIQLREYVPLDSSIRKQTYTYAIKDSALGLDMYTKAAVGEKKKPCVIFAFGGAFVGGHRDDSLYNQYFNSLVNHDFIVVSISYRLGLRGVTGISIFNTSPLKKAVDEAVEDLFDATAWVISHSDSLGIDTAKIVLSGSSSGAITVQTAEFQLCNRKPAAQKLPADFRYAGVIAFSGAVLSYDGRIKYKTEPAPALMFHGTADRIVPYKKIKLFKRGLYGSSSLAASFHKKGYPYFIYREVGMGHEISVLPMIEDLPVIETFLDQYILQKKRYQKDLTFKDPDAKPILTISARALFEKLKNVQR